MLRDDIKTTAFFQRGGPMTKKGSSSVSSFTLVLTAQRHLAIARSPPKIGRSSTQLACARARRRMRAGDEREFQVSRLLLLSGFRLTLATRIRNCARLGNRKRMYLAHQRPARGICRYLRMPIALPPHTRTRETLHPCGTIDRSNTWRRALPHRVQL
jgi:hypothetical protein